MRRGQVKRIRKPCSPGDQKMGRAPFLTFLYFSSLDKKLDASFLTL